MKSILSVLALAMCFSLYAQRPPGIDRPPLANAMLQGCIDQDFATSCNENKLGEILSSVITNDLISDLPNKKPDHFSISCLFITDKDGKVIPEYTEARSESKKLENELVAYINSDLPRLTPKNMKFAERRSVQIVHQTFLRNPKTNGYYIAHKGEIFSKKIKPDNITLDKAPVFPGCDENLDFEEQMECVREKIFEHISKNFRIQHQRPLYINMSIELLVDSDGKVHVDFIGGSAPDKYEYEVYRLVNTLPLLKPASVKEIPAVSNIELKPLIFK